MSFSSPNRDVQELWDHAIQLILKGELVHSRLEGAMAREIERLRKERDDSPSRFSATYPRGFRSLCCKPNTGFFVNGESVKISAIAFEV